MIDKENRKIVISIKGFMQGGGEILPIRLANALHKEGYKVYIHALQDKEESKIRELLNPDIIVFKCHKAWKMALFLLKNNIDVVHTHSVDCQIFISGIKRKIPLVKVYHIATSHGGYEGVPFEKAKQYIQKVDPQIDVWTYVADNNIGTLVDSGVDKKKCIKIGNGMERPKKIKSITRLKMNVPENASVVMVITRAVDKKCWRECIKTVALARQKTELDIHLILCGTGNVYNQLIEEETADYVHLLGVVNNPCDYYAAADVGMLLSIRECAPLGIIEMYYAGIPVVATQTGDVGHMMDYNGKLTGCLIQLNKDGKVPISDAANGLVKLLTNKSFYKECANFAKEKGKEFGIDYIMKQYLRVYLH